MLSDYLTTTFPSTTTTRGLKMNAKKKAAIVTRVNRISSKWSGPVFHSAGFDIGLHIESVIAHLQKEDTELAEYQESAEVSYDRTMERNADEVEVGDNLNRQEILVDIAVLERLLELINEDK